MDREKVKILSMFKEGKISAEEALELLESGKKERFNFSFDRYPIKDMFEQAFRRTLGITGGVLSTVLEEMKDMVEYAGRNFLGGESELVAARSITEEIDPGEALLLKLEGQDDSFNVTTHKDLDNEIVITAEILVPKTSLNLAREIEVANEKDGAQVRVFSRVKGLRDGVRKKYRIRYDVRIPSAMRVFVSTRNGDISIVDTGSGADAENRNGNILLAGVKGDVVARSSNGNIRVLNISGSAKLEVKNGTIRTKGIGGAITARALAGSLKFDGINGPVNAETRTGSISARILSLSENDLHVMKSNMGPIKIFAAEGANFRAEAITRMGKIVTDFKTSEFMMESVRGTVIHVGKGGPATLSVETGFGSIKILRDTSVESEF